MKSILRKCPNCHSYTMQERCPKCGEATLVAHPARYSPDDRYARYRSPLAYREQKLGDLVD